MLGADKSKTGIVKLPAVSRYTFDGFGFERLEAAPSVQLISRDAFVTDMAIKVDQLGIEIKGLAREFDGLKTTITQLREDTDRNYRFSSFQESELRARNNKVEDILRRYKEMKRRLDAIDGNRKGDYQSFESLEAVSKRLTELGTLERRFRDVERKLKISAGFFCGSVLMWLATFLSG